MLAVDEATLAPFRERVAPAVKAAFDQGVVFLAAGDYPKAELSFKKAIDPDVDSTAPLTFLAASFAAAGKDHEAASAWQTALVDGTDFPQIYVWLADALLRTHDFGAARAILEEAAGKWPADTRFTKPLAMLYGTFGRGREAVRTLERYLDDRQDDRDALFLRGAVDLHRPRRRRGRAHPRRRPQARPRLRGRLPASTRTASGPRQAVGRLPGYREVDPKKKPPRPQRSPRDFLCALRDLRGFFRSWLAVAGVVVRRRDFLPRAGFFAAGFFAAAFFGAAASDGRAARARGLRGLARPSSSAVVSIGIGSIVSSSLVGRLRRRRASRGCGASIG